MVYLITEDQTSGRRFWKKALKELLGEDKYKLAAFDRGIDGQVITGNTSLDDQVNNVLQYAVPDDVIFIAFDNIGASKRVNRSSGEEIGFDSGDFIIRTREKCRKFEVKVYFTSYYCFEELYLSYSELARLYQEDGSDSRLVDTLNYVKKHIQDGTEYFDIDNEHIKYVTRIRADAGTNKEHFADALLYHATGGIRHGLFRISKRRNQDHILKCWTGTCDEVRKDTRALSENGFICTNCKFKMKDSNSVDKLLDLNDNSLCQDREITFRDLQKWK